MVIKLSPEIIRDFQRSLAEEEKSPATIEKYIRDVKKFYDYLPDGKEIEKEGICSYKRFLSEKYPAVSVNSMLAALNSLLKFVGLGSMKVKRIRIQRQVFRPEEKELEIKEYKRLLRTADRGQRLLQKPWISDRIRTKHLYLKLNTGRKNQGLSRILFMVL